MIPYGRHSLDESDIEAVVRVLRNGPLTCGPEVDRFEAELASACRAEHAIVVNSGTAALHLALLALGVGRGDVVIVPAITFVATANAVLLAGADVVFSDVDPVTGLMREQELDAALARCEGKRVAAVIPVHLAGWTVEMQTIASLASKVGAQVVEDACHALGAVDIHGHTVGDCAFSTAAAFSFHPVKTIAMGEGGAVTTNDAKLAEKIKQLRSHGIVRNPGSFKLCEQAFSESGTVNPWYYEQQDLGLNYRASDILCALARSQLGKLSRFLVAREELAGLYEELLKPLSPYITPIRSQALAPGRHLFSVHVDFDLIGITRVQMMRKLSESGIGSQVHYIPVHWQPYYRERYGLIDLPGAAKYYSGCLSLPLYPDMAASVVRRVVTTLGQLVP